MDAEVLRTLQPGGKASMAEQMSWVYKVDQQKAPLRIKQRVFQMGEHISGVLADFWLSLSGNLAAAPSATPELRSTPKTSTSGPAGWRLHGVEASSLNGIITPVSRTRPKCQVLPG